MRRILGSCVLLAFAAIALAQPASVQPPHVGEGRTMILVMTSGMAAAPQAFALMKEGGSAMDAAISAAVAQVVWCAGAWSSLAGVLSLIYYHAETGRVSTLDAGFARPIQGAGARLVPGMVPGLAAAHARFGRLPWARLFDPAIAWAEKGVPVDHNLARLLAWRAPVLAADVGARETLLAADLHPPAAGQLLRQPALAATLRSLAGEGPAHMTSGSWAQQFARLDGAPSLQDLWTYRAQWVEPLRGRFQGRDIMTIGLPQLGGLCLLESLALLARDAAALRSPRTPTAIARLVHAGEPCYAGYQRLAADPASRLHPARLETLRTEIADGRGLPLADRLAGRPFEGHSDIVIAADAAGNVAVLAHSINTTAWGKQALFVQGVSVSDAGGDQSALVRQVAPGAHVPNALNPTMLLDAGRPVVAMASIGGSISELMLQASIDMLVDGASSRAVVAAPRYLRPLWPRLGAFQFLMLFGLGAVAVALWWLLRKETLLLRAAALLAWGGAATWGIALVLAAAGGPHAPLALLDRPMVQGLTLLTGSALLAWVLLAQAYRGRAWRWKLSCTCAILALLLAPLLLRGSLVPVTLVEAGKFDAATLAAWRAAGITVAEIHADAPLGYWAGVAIDPSRADRLQGAVTPGLGGTVISE